MVSTSLTATGMPATGDCGAPVDRYDVELLRALGGQLRRRGQERPHLVRPRRRSARAIEARISVAEVSPRGEHRRQLRAGAVAELGAHAPVSAIRGTRKRSPSRSGALRRASSTGSDGSGHVVAKDVRPRDRRGGRLARRRPRPPRHARRARGSGRAAPRARAVSSSVSCQARELRDVLDVDLDRHGRQSNGRGRGDSDAEVRPQRDRHPPVDEGGCHRHLAVVDPPNHRDREGAAAIACSTPETQDPRAIVCAAVREIDHGRAASAARPRTHRPAVSDQGAADPQQRRSTQFASQARPPHPQQRARRTRCAVRRRATVELQHRHDGIARLAKG